LHQPARVKGNIETPALQMDKGVMFEGSCKMENMRSSSPPALVGAPASVPPPIAIAEFPKKT
jgi:cytoskeletal protein CcmA (bactofilin family)